MNFYGLWEFCLDLLSRLTSFANGLLDFLFWDIANTGLTVIELLFGSWVFTWLVVKIASTAFE